MKIFKKIPIAIVLYMAIFCAIGISAAASLSRQIKEIEGLVRVQDVDSGITLDLRYATENNFTGKKIYPVAVCVLRKETALKLSCANTQFQKDGYRVKVWDAYRPLYVQKIFWSLVLDDRYVANPSKGGSKHNRGGAVDITLIDEDGKEIEMPSGFDDFSKRASPVNPDMSPQAKKNVEYLRRVMTENGFEPITDEWWHFDDKDWRKFSVVDVILEKFLDETFDVLGSLDKNISQVLIVRSVPSDSSRAKMTAWERTNNGWLVVLDPIDAVVGRRGIAMPNDKKEGDGTTPAGIFSIDTAFGYEPVIETKLSYRQITENDFWVDDPESLNYNQWVKGKPKAKSFERLKRDDNLYKYAIIINYNTDPVVPYKGSAIFIHVWRAVDSPTAGCVAVSEKNLLTLLKWLDRSKNPAVILGH